VMEQIKQELERREMEKLIENSTLTAENGRVLCIGVLEGDNFECINCDGPPSWERKGLNLFWDKWRKARNEGGTGFCGWNILEFDLYFMGKRSRITGAKLPDDLQTGTGRMYWNKNFHDLMVLWEFGKYGGRRKLDVVAKRLGLEGKTGDGKHFWKLWSEDRPAAMQYLQRDVELCRDIAIKCGIYDTREEANRMVAQEHKAELERAK